MAISQWCGRLHRVFARAGRSESGTVPRGLRGFDPDQAGQGPDGQRSAVDRKHRGGIASLRGGDRQKRGSPAAADLFYRCRECLDIARGSAPEEVDMHLFSPDPFLASQAAEAALAGKSGSNIALTSGTDSNGYFVDPAVTSVVNYDVNPNSSGTSIPFPGIPGATGSKENFAAEVLTYLQFPAAGFYQMAVRSDDGFRLTAGAPGDPNALVVGLFEGARESF